MGTAAAILLLGQILKIIELTLTYELKRLEHMTPAEQEQYWGPRKKWDAFWWGVADKVANIAFPNGDQPSQPAPTPGPTQ